MKNKIIVLYCLLAGCSTFQSRVIAPVSVHHDVPIANVAITPMFLKNVTFKVYDLADLKSMVEQDEKDGTSPLFYVLDQTNYDALAFNFADMKRYIEDQKSKIDYLLAGIAINAEVKKMNPYKTLGLEPGADPDQIKAAFRTLAKKYHPDVNPDPASTEKFKEISTAYDALTNPKPNQQDFEFHMNMEEMLNQRFRDIFGHATGRRVNSDTTVVYEIDLLQAFMGCEIDIRVLSKSFRVKIPRGIENGMRIRVPGAGRTEHSHLPPGSLYVIVRIKSHPIFHRLGNDLVTRIEINSFEAILGTTRQITMLDGEIVTVNVTSGSQFGDRLIVAQRGFFGLSSASRGDLLVELLIKTPAIEESQREFISKIQELLPAISGDKE